MDDNQTSSYTQSQLNENKQKIIQLFYTNVKGKKADTSLSNAGHDGKVGHWLETQMGIIHNRNNAPDLLGFEMKNDTLSKTTFGDWSADFRIFAGSDKLLTQDEFLEAFGQPNPKKVFNGKPRRAWSGSIVPKIGGFNYAGQKLSVDSNNNILAIYSHSQDSRDDKDAIVPKNFRQDNIVLAKWSADYMRQRINSKFGNGWFKCLTDKYGVYSEIVFGDPVTFEFFIEKVKSGDIIFDGGMYQGNPRPYAQWRASNGFWHRLITSRY